MWRTIEEVGRITAEDGRRNFWQERLKDWQAYYSYYMVSILIEKNLKDY